MFATALRLVGYDLERHWLQLKAQAEDFKDRTTDEIKGKAIDAGMAVGLALAGIWFVVLTVIAGLIALYLWVEVLRGPIVALGAVAGTTALLAVILFIAAAKRGGTSSRRRPLPVRDTVRTAAHASAAAYAPAAARASGAAHAPSAARASATHSTARATDEPFYEAITRDLTDQTATAATEALDAAAGIVRRSPREFILATMAVAIAAGVIIGRRR